MNKSILLALAAIVIFSLSVYAADMPQPVDPTAALTTEGLVEKAAAPQSDVRALFGAKVGQYDWRGIGIYGDGYDGAGITINPTNGYLYLMSQYRYGSYPYYYRIHVVRVDASGDPVRVGYMRVPRHNPPGYYADPPWGIGHSYPASGAMVWYTIADFYTPHFCEMRKYPSGAWTGTQFTLGPYPYYYWIGDLAENFAGDYTDDHIFGIRVGGGGSDCNIFEWTRTGAEVRNFGNSAWNYVSQRGCTYCDNNDKWYVGGWNSDRIWEYDEGTGANTAEMSCLPGVAGLCYDDINDPNNEYLWVQHNSTSDQLDKWLIVKPVPDLDIDDNNGSNSGNTVELTGFRGGVVVGNFIIVNPGGGSSLTAPNVDYWDGPSQRDLDRITYSSTDLERLHPANGKEIPASCVSFTGPASLINPNSAQCFVQVNIPWVSGGGQFPWTYSGEASAVGEPAYSTWTTDHFVLTVNVVAGQAPGDGGPPNAFWSIDNGGATELMWGEFTFGNGVYNLYKAEGQSESFVKLNGSPMHNNSFLDGDVLDGRTYAYKLGVVLGNGEEFPVGPISVTRGLRPQVHLLSGNFPNPVSEATEIRYGIASQAQVSLKVYNAAGQMVETLVDEYKTPGYYSASWNAEDATNGVYFYRLTAGDFSATGKLVVLR